MNQEQISNQHIIHDAAAYLFWTFAEAVGVAGANEAVIDTAGQCLMETPFVADVLSQYGFHNLPLDGRREFGRAIAAEAERYAVNDENMNGLIYAEDAQKGRSPSAMDVQATHLATIPRRVITSGPKIEKIGRLCLRHPLPAVVFSDSRPKGRFLEVEDTSAALGFHLPMFLANFTTNQLGNRMFASTGIFSIPVPDIHKGDEWSKAIQNSTRFTSGCQFFGPDGIIEVEVKW